MCLLPIPLPNLPFGSLADPPLLCWVSPRSWLQAPLGFVTSVRPRVPKHHDGDICLAQSCSCQSRQGLCLPAPCLLTPSRARGLRVGARPHGDDHHNLPRPQQRDGRGVGGQCQLRIAGQRGRIWPQVLQERAEPLAGSCTLQFIPRGFPARGGAGVGFVGVEGFLVAGEGLQRWLKLLQTPPAPGQSRHPPTLARS